MFHILMKNNLPCLNGRSHQLPGMRAGRGVRAPVEVADELVAEEGFAAAWQAHQDDDELLTVRPLARAAGVP